MMSHEPGFERDADQPMTYHIRIRGHLSPQRTNWFEGLVITLEEDGNTLLTGLMVDQAALHGILKKIRDLGMPLLLVTSVGSDSHETPEVKSALVGSSDS